jgi:hypothetical protein
VQRGEIEAGRDAEVVAVIDDQLEGRRRNGEGRNGGDRRGAGTDVDRQEGGCTGDRRRRGGARCA